MSTFSYYISNARKAPVRLVARRAFERGLRQSGRFLVRVADTRRRSYSPAQVRLAPPRLGAAREAIARVEAEWLAPVTQHYLDHRFDLLGSGWVRVRHGMECSGVEGFSYRAHSSKPDRPGKWLRNVVNHANLAEAVRIWKLIEGDYAPIDWQLDFKSGFRWSERTWYLDIAYGHRRGADIKVPWELARMQHLPQLALAFEFACRREHGFVAPGQYQREFRNQVIDFISTNPPRFGVNWSCTMEVAIRAVNWLMAYDLFRSFGAQFDESFELYFARSILDHGRHIIGNLEWSPGRRANHYLADVAGLLFIAGYLDRNDETAAWLIFSLRELVVEVGAQFGEDGANLEGSTSYHRLAAEIVAYATAFAIGLPSRGTLHGFTGFPPWYGERLLRMARFAEHMTKPDGCVAQIGDNDSGRFVKIHPVFSTTTVADAKERCSNLRRYHGLSDDEIHWQENHLDHRSLVGALETLFGAENELQNVRTASFDAVIVSAMAGGARFARPSIGTLQPAKIDAANRGLWEEARAAIAALPPERRRKIEIELAGDDLRAGLEALAYPNFGVYLFRSRRLWLAVRCGPVGQGGVGGHSHNDQLNVELTIDGKNLWRDPGTYLYTALPQWRNRYRSAVAHHAPRVGPGEPACLDAGLFRLGNARDGECLYFAPDGFVGRYRGFGPPVYRVIIPEASRLKIADFKGKVSADALMPARNGARAAVAFSPGYGIRLEQGE